MDDLIDIVPFADGEPRKFNCLEGHSTSDWGFLELRVVDALVLRLAIRCVSFCPSHGKREFYFDIPIVLPAAVNYQVTPGYKLVYREKPCF